MQSQRVIPVQSQAKAEKSKQNGRSVKAKETREKIACDVREVSPTDKEKESTSCYVREVTRSDEPLVKKHTADPTAHKRSKETHDPCACS